MSCHGFFQVGHKEFGNLNTDGTIAVNTLASEIQRLPVVHMVSGSSPKPLLVCVCVCVCVCVVWPFLTSLPAGESQGSPLAKSLPTVALSVLC
jgi:hypothetical protein